MRHFGNRLRPLGGATMKHSDKLLLPNFLTTSASGLRECNATSREFGID